MRKIQISVACALALAFVGVATLKSAEDGGVQGKATVRAKHGDVSYQVGGSWVPLPINTELDAGVIIRTGPNSTVDLSVNGLSSALRIEPDTTLAIPTMTRSDTSRDADQDTMLDLQDGAILGNVKKITANSRYEIKTAHGVAGIRGTDYHVRSKLEADGRHTVTFTSITGQVIVSAVIDPGGPTVVKVLRDGESWTPGYGDVVPTPIYELQLYETGIASLLGSITPIGQPPQPPPVIYPFPTGGQSSVSSAE
ncbi:MAG TPA: FecR domain-containing protein [Candidatus Baltobacteraceae bacterium]|jgi:hypothetical protein|nr:FecR domain-containing protein [Candidatus Baltobacteraceae bacterium]